MSQIPHASKPCRTPGTDKWECPWVMATEPGQFPAERYEALRCTSEQAPGREPEVGSPLFACHRTAEGKEIACAGWLAAVGHRHIGVRLAVSQGHLPAEVLWPREGWPELFDNYPEMAARQSGLEPEPEEEL